MKAPLFSAGAVSLFAFFGNGDGTVKRYSKTELARCDGREGRPAWIAWRGKIYDVSESFLWKGGRLGRR